MIRALLVMGISLSLGSKDVHTSCIDKRSIVYHIARSEGFYKRGSLPNRLHNPGSLVYARQHGAVHHRSGFAQFATNQEGFEALDRYVSSKLRRHIKLHKGWKYL